MPCVCWDVLLPSSVDHCGIPKIHFSYIASYANTLERTFTFQPHAAIKQPQFDRVLFSVFNPLSTKVVLVIHLVIPKFKAKGNAVADAQALIVMVNYTIFYSERLFPLSTQQRQLWWQWKGAFYWGANKWILFKMCHVVHLCYDGSGSQSFR